MAEIVDLFAALPPRVVDSRLIVLRRAFGSRPFKVGEMAALLEMDVASAFHLCVNEPLRDDLSRITPSGEGGFRLEPTSPAKAALPRWKAQYLPIMREMGEFGAPAFARAAFVPVATSVFICNQFLQAGLLVRACPKPEDAHAIYVVRKRKVIRNGPHVPVIRYPRRKVIWRKEPAPLPAPLRAAPVYPSA